MRSSSILLLVAAVWACLFVPSEAHVRLLYTGVPIRNAAGPALDGAYSVSGPCGGVSKYGVQGITQVTSGTAMSLKIAYNGGHQSPSNAFHAAYVCDSKLVAGSTFDDSVLRGTSPITAASPGVIPLTNTNGAMTVPAPTSSTAGYVLAFTVPKVTSATNCVISLLDQNNWGGCVDVTILPSGSSSTPTTQQQSMVAAYCDLMTASCTGVNAVWASRSLCMIDAANYTSAAAAGAVTTGDNFECRQNQASLVTKDNAATQCPLAGPKSTACTDPAGKTRADSPCFTYCKSLIATCPATAYRSYFTQSYDKTIQMRNCLQKCADSYIKSTGWEYGLGNNTACRISALAQGNCVDANPAGVGQCGLANPLVIAADKLSAVYTTAPGQCDTPMQAAENTVAGCCCLSGSIEVIHVRGYTFSTIKTMNDWTMSGPMCGAGTVAIKNPINNSTSTATFSTPVTPPVFSFRAQQTKDTSLVDQTGSVTIAGDSFDFRLTMTTTGQGLIVLTNNNANKPRVCSTQAVIQSRIDTSTYTSPDGISAASQLASSSVVITLILAALIAFFARV